MTPKKLYAALTEMPQKAAMVFSTPEGEIKGGYHVTEWKAANVTSIDCGGTMNQFKEAQLQLLDGWGGDHMSVEKFNAILKVSMEKESELANSPLRIEFGVGNAQMRIYEMTDPILDGDTVRIPLGDMSAICKPAQRVAVDVSNQNCCGGQRQSCC